MKIKFCWTAKFLSKKLLKYPFNQKQAQRMDKSTKLHKEGSQSYTEWLKNEALKMVWKMIKQMPSHCCKNHHNDFFFTSFFSPLPTQWFTTSFSLTEGSFTSIKSQRSIFNLFKLFFFFGFFPYSITNSWISEILFPYWYWQECISISSDLHFLSSPIWAFSNLTSTSLIVTFAFLWFVLLLQFLLLCFSGNPSVIWGDQKWVLSIFNPTARTDSWQARPVRCFYPLKPRWTRWLWHSGALSACSRRAWRGRCKFI